ncbi:Clp protease N-terminal domain-containing protein [Streptomyces hyaluromycini]|uniref:Clp protease N-terminal domain-containing protein n=1 Tax=Streptomyces hyaluromycini TaxID=1377993 RepID=UPI000B5C96F4|nr:Clp protease N-terminal domain-containing protein [Streptomyces hyaluromycini]
MVFERYSYDARRVVVEAKHEAQRRNWAEILPAHLLYAIIDDTHGLAGRLLAMSSSPRIRGELDSGVLPARTGAPRDEHVPFAASTRQVIEATTAAADELRHANISSLHLLLGLLQDTGVVGELLARHGIAREQVLRGFMLVGEVLRDLPLHSSVTQALRAAAPTGPPVGTRELLVALMRADNAGEWHRIWLHCGNDEAVAAMPFQDPEQGPGGAAAGLWESIPLTSACVTALEVAARLAKRYDMWPLPPGLLALGLVADDTCGASRALGQGLGRLELIDLLQRAILGTTLSGLRTALPQILDEVNRERADVPREDEQPQSPAPTPPAPPGPAAVPTGTPGGPVSAWFPACPRHQTGDMVRLVSSVYDEGTARTESFGPVAGSAGGHVFIGAARQVGGIQTALAKRLSPRPTLQPSPGVPVLMACLIGIVGGIIAAGLYASGSSTEHPSATRAAALGFLAVMAIPVVALLAVASKIGSRLARVESGMATAMPMWLAAWYCGRCDGVFFPPGEYPEGVIPDTLMPTAVFQQAVWRAGGFTSEGDPVK